MHNNIHNICRNDYLIKQLISLYKEIVQVINDSQKFINVKKNTISFFRIKTTNFSFCDCRL